MTNLSNKTIGYIASGVAILIGLGFLYTGNKGETSTHSFIPSVTNVGDKGNISFFRPLSGETGGGGKKSRRKNKSRICSKKRR